MKAKVSVFLICVLALSTVGMATGQTRIKGNGKVTTRTISISEYDEIDLAGNMTFEYEQSDAAPFLSITVDENIFEYLRAEVKGGKLIIAPERREYGFGEGYNLDPTVFTVKSNSRELKKVNKAGSGNFVANSPLKVGLLQVNIGGSGSIRLTKNVTGDELKMNVSGSGKIETSDVVRVENTNLNVAGSGKIKISNIETETLRCNVAGSGDIELQGGHAKAANYNIAGSGNIAYACETVQLKTNVSGSGSIRQRP
jgi:hypothetical protein